MLGDVSILPIGRTIIRAMKLSIRTLTPDLWPALEDLFGEKGACNGCWCMYWRIGPEYRKRSRGENKIALRKVVADGPPPGLIAFDGDLAVGWCQLTPRDALPWLDRAWPRVDDRPVWSISCFYVRIGYRKKGISEALLHAAVKAAERAGAEVIEAYPLDGDLSPSATSTGYVSTLKRVGFRIVGYRTPPRPIMRLNLTMRGRRKIRGLYFSGRSVHNALSAMDCTG